MDITLNAVEARVLGCLMEKEATTPEYYPLTLNALVAACNQKSNRNPVMQVSDTDVVRALDGLRERKLAWEGTSNVGRVPKYSHGAKELLCLSPSRSAILCELLVRGAQTLGELRTHAGRMCEFADTDQVSAVLVELVAREQGALVAKCPRSPGQREERFAHLLCGPLEDVGGGVVEEPARQVVHAENERIGRLEAEVADLRAELGKMRAELNAFVEQFK